MASNLNIQLVHVPTAEFRLWSVMIVVGLLVMIGLVARLAALVGAGEMAYAYFTQHQPNGLWPLQNGGELAMLYCFAFLVIAFAGTGAFAVRGRGKPLAV